MKNILSNKRGDGYIEIAVAVLVIAFILLLIVSVWSLITLKQDMRYLCAELIDIATKTGKVGSEVYSRFSELCEESGIVPDVEFSATYFDSVTGKVQLGDVISCRLTHNLVLSGFGGFTLPISVTAEQSGLSRIYWK